MAPTALAGRRHSRLCLDLRWLAFRASLASAEAGPKGCAGARDSPSMAPTALAESTRPSGPGIRTKSPGWKPGSMIHANTRHRAAVRLAGRRPLESTRPSRPGIRTKSPGRKPGSMIHANPRLRAAVRLAGRRPLESTRPSGPGIRTRIGVGRPDWVRAPLPPNRAGGSPAHGSPVDGYLVKD